MKDMFAKRAKITGAAVLAALFLTSNAFAQATESRMAGIALSSDEPIHIESDKLEVKDKENTALFSGNVVAIQGTTTLKAANMTVDYKSGGNPVTSSGSADIKSILVEGNVALNSGKQNATADTGLFDMAAQTLTLEGKQVVLTEGNNVFTGCRLTVYMQTGEAHLESCGGRVQIQLDPKSTKK
jgi:lipopolysaccharide export system protein LptA